MDAALLVLFDLDGTLLDGSGLPAAMRRTCERLAAGLPGVTADALVAANTAAWQRLWPEAEDEYLLGGRSGDDVGTDAWHATLHAVGVDDPVTLARATAWWVEEERATFRVFDDVPSVLDDLDSAGVRVGLLTNGAASVQRLKLEVAGLADRFEPLVISSEAGLRKPDERVFGVALHRAGVPAARTWFVGDNLWHDIAPAALAGLRTAWIDRRGRDLDPSWPQPDVVLRTLADLPPLLLASAQEPR